MATTNPSMVLVGDEPTSGLAPMSPSSQIINTSFLSFCVIGIAESTIPIDVDKLMPSVRSDLLAVNPGFSSIVVRNKKGEQWWKKVDVRVEDHVVIPTFPQDLTPEDYTKIYDEYFSKIFSEKLPENRPLWELHIFKYPTKTAMGTLVFKMHHALGDGFSIMGAIFSCLRRADDPSLPLTFPYSKPKSEGKKKNIYIRGLNLMSRCFNTLADLMSNMLHATLLEDSISAIRSGAHLVELMPTETAKITFSLEDIRQIKSMIGASVTEVMVGIVFYAIELYTQMMGDGDGKFSANTRRTALVVLNTRMLDGYRSLDDMLKKKMWGNHFSFIHIPVPNNHEGDKIDPKKFIFLGQEIIKRNKNSMAVFLNGILLKLMGGLRGTEAASQYVHSVMQKASVTVSNLVGPMEQMAIADHPISNIFFTVQGVPQSIVFPVISYNGTLTIGITVEKGFIDSKQMISCIEQAFKKLLEDSRTG